MKTETKAMNMGRLAGLAWAALLVASADVGRAQVGPVPTDAGTPRNLEATKDPRPPAEQFAACAGIADRAKRADCIERQTTRGNPATGSVGQEPARPPGKRTE